MRSSPRSLYMKVEYEVYVKHKDDDHDGWGRLKTCSCTDDTMAERWLKEREAFAHGRAFVRRNGPMNYEFKVCRVEYLNHGSFISENYNEPKELNPVDFMRGDVVERSRERVRGFVSS